MRSQAELGNEDRLSVRLESSRFVQPVVALLAGSSGWKPQFVKERLIPFFGRVHKAIKRYYFYVSFIIGIMTKLHRDVLQFCKLHRMLQEGKLK